MHAPEYVVEYLDGLMPRVIPDAELVQSVTTPSSKHPLDTYPLNSVGVGFSKVFFDNSHT